MSEQQVDSRQAPLHGSATAYGHPAAPPQLSAVLLCGLRPCLLGSAGRCKLPAADLLAGLGACGSPRLLDALIDSDVCEYLFEVLRDSCAHRSKEGSMVQSKVVTALRYFSYQGWYVSRLTERVLSLNNAVQIRLHSANQLGGQQAPASYPGGHGALGNVSFSTASILFDLLE